MQIALFAAYVFVDLCGVLFFTLTVNYIWQYPERSRARTTVILIVTIMLSCIVSSLVVRAVPDSMFSFAANDKSEDYDFYLFFTSLHGLFNGLVLLFAPYLILRVKRYFSVLLLEVSLLFCVEASFSIVATVFRLNTDNASKTLIECVFEIIAYILLSAVFVFVSRRGRALPFWNVIDSIPKWIYVLIVIFAFTVYCKNGLFDGGISLRIAGNIYDLLWIISTIGIAVCGIYFIYKLFSMSNQQNQIIKQMSIQQTNYEQMLKSDEKLREFRHDYKNHMMVVTALLNSGRNNEAADYLEKVKVSSGLIGRQFSTGSFIADAILNNKNTIAEEYAIHLSFSGRIPEKGIENSDFCTVFANLLDNAIEGTKHFQGNRYVKIESNVRNGMLALTLTNPVNKKVIIKNNRIRTSKIDKHNHGIGLRNVERIAEKYYGVLLLGCDEKEFCADVSLKMNLE